jgi:hypothetical protein
MKAARIGQEEYKETLFHGQTTRPTPLPSSHRDVCDGAHKRREDDVDAPCESDEVSKHWKVGTLGLDNKETNEQTAYTRRKKGEEGVGVGSSPHVYLLM